MTVAEKRKDPYKRYLAKVSQAESGGNPNAKNQNGTASGLYQFTEGTWKGLNDKYNLGYTLKDRFDPVKSERVARLFTEENANILRNNIGREPQDADLYMAHFLGAGGATNFYKALEVNPNTPISAVMSPLAIQSNKPVVFNKDGSLKTVSEIYGWAKQKMGEPVSEFSYLEEPEENITFDSEKAGLQALPDMEEPAKVQQAKQELNRQTNEFNFLQNYLKESQLAEQQKRVPEQNIPVEPVPTPLQRFSQLGVTQFQTGGEIPVSSRGMYEYPNQTVIVPTDGSITMKGMDKPIIGTSLQTGEKKIMLPNIDYYFDNTNQVLETPLINE